MSAGRAQELWPGPRPPVEAGAGLRDGAHTPKGPGKTESSTGFWSQRGQVVKAPTEEGRGRKARNLGKRLMFKLLKSGAGIEVSA